MTCWSRCLSKQALSWSPSAPGKPGPGGWVPKKWKPSSCPKKSADRTRPGAESGGRPRILCILRRTVQANDERPDGRKGPKSHFVTDHHPKSGFETRPARYFPSFNTTLSRGLLLSGGKSPNRHLAGRLSRIAFCATRPAMHYGIAGGDPLQ